MVYKGYIMANTEETTVILLEGKDGLTEACDAFMAAQGNTVQDSTLLNILDVLGSISLFLLPIGLLVLLYVTYDLDPNEPEHCSS